MITNKQGFSLAELVLAVGIIGIITAMGLAITKHTMDKAYNGYWYTGYGTLLSIIAELEKNDVFEPIENPDPDPDSDKLISTSAGKFAEELGKLLNVTASGSTVTAKNGIIYSITALPDNDKNGIADYIIDMTVPQRKSRENPAGWTTVRLAYIREQIEGQEKYLLVPANYVTESPRYIYLGNRRDLLPFYRDDGTRMQNSYISGDTSPKTPSSYEQVYCSLHTQGPNIVAKKSLVNNSKKSDESDESDESDVQVEIFKCPTDSGNSKGIIRLMNPANVK